MHNPSNTGAKTAKITIKVFFRTVVVFLQGVIELDGKS